jgi:hypothetical protein
LNLNRVSPREILFAAFFFGLVAFLILGWKWHQLGTLSEVPLVDPAGVLQVKCWQTLNAAEFARGRFPLWNPHTGLGQPHLANIQTGVFFPFSLLYVMFARPGVYDLVLASKLILCALLIYFLLRRWWLTWPSAAAASLIYAFGGYSLWFIQLIDMNSQIFLPLLIHLWGRLTFCINRRNLVSAGLTCAVIITGGHPEAAFNTFLVAGLFALFLVLSRGKIRKRIPHGLLAIAASLVLGAMCSAAVLLPFTNYLSRSFSLHAPGFGLFHLDIRGLANLLYPGIHLVFSDLPSRIPVEMLDQGLAGMLKAGYDQTAVPGVPPGAGILIIFLALTGIMSLKKQAPAACFFAFLLIILLGLTFGLPGFRLLALIPPLHVASNFKFYFSEIHFCIAILAGFGMERLLGKHGPAVLSSRSFGFFWAGTFIALILAWIQFRLTPGVCGYPCGVVGTDVFQYDSLWLFLAVILITGARRWPLRRKLFSSMLVMILCGSLFCLSRSVRPYIELGTRNLSQAPYLAYLKGKADASQGFRITGLDGFFPPNLPLRWGLDDIRSSDAVFYRPYMELLNALNHHTERQSVDYFYPSYYTRASSDHLDEGLAALMGIRYAVGLMPLDAGLIIEDALIRASLVLAEERPQKILSTRRHEDMQVLFMHAPARLDYQISPGQKKGVLEFTPWLDKRISGCHNADGVGFQASLRTAQGKRLLYNRFFGRESLPIRTGPLGIALSELDQNEPLDLSLTTQPGPGGNRNCDWSGWAGLAIRKPFMDAPRFRIIKSRDQEGRKVYISENPSVFPHAFSTSRARVVEDKITRLALLSQFSREQLREIILIERQEGEPGFSGDRGYIRWLARGADEMRLEVRRASPGYLVLVQAYYPGWRAYRDGTEVRILRADHALCSVAIPHGKHRVCFRFEPGDFQIGLWTSLSSLGFGLIFFALAFFQKKKRDQG